MTDLFLHFANPAHFTKGPSEEWLRDAPFRAFVKIPLLQSVHIDGGRVRLDLHRGSQNLGYATLAWDTVTEIHTPKVGSWLEADAIIYELDLMRQVDGAECSELIVRSMEECGWQVKHYSEHIWTDKLRGAWGEFNAWVRAQQQMHG